MSLIVLVSVLFLSLHAHPQQMITLKSLLKQLTSKLSNGIHQKTNSVEWND